MTQPTTQSKPGDHMADGTIYAGISPDTGKAMYAMPADAPLTMKFNQAKKYAAKFASLDAHGQKNWRLPTKAELNVLFNNRAAIGGFNASGPAGWYWSATRDGNWYAWCQRFRGKDVRWFRDGSQIYNGKDFPSSVRLVR